MEISQVGINLIKSFEGCELKAYQDVAGVWTIGWGHTSGVKQGDTVTQNQADAILISDVESYAQAVNDLVKVKLNQYQFDALTSFCYNVGKQALATSTLLQKLNSGDYNGASNEFILWVHAGGKVVQGLINRRNAEKALFNKAVASTTQTYTIRSGENLTVISKRFNTSIGNIMGLNPQIKNQNLIYAGQQIKVPAK